MNTQLAPLCQNLQKLRRETGLSQSGAAKGLGLSQVLLSHYENGARKPSLEFILRACDFYSVSADYLLGRSGVRDGNAVCPAEEPGNDNRLVGMASAKLGQSLLIASIKVVYSLLSDLRHASLVSEVTAMLGAVVARVFYRLCRASGQESTYFPGNAYETASAADFLGCDLRVERALTGLRDSGQELPVFSYQDLEAAHGQQFKALATLMHQSCERIRKLT